MIDWIESFIEEFTMDIIIGNQYLIKNKQNLIKKMKLRFESTLRFVTRKIFSDPNKIITILERSDCHRSKPLWGKYSLLFIY